MTPSQSTLKGGGKTVWQRLKVFIYRIFIKLLAIHYKSYAFSYTIVVENIRVLHECRDQEFEKELSALGLWKTGNNLNDNRYSLSAWGLHFASFWFEFVDKLIIGSEEKEILISRKGSDLLLNYPKKTTMKYSDNQSSIQRIFLENKSKKYVSVIENKQEDVKEAPKKKNKAMEIDDSF